MSVFSDGLIDVEVLGLVCGWSWLYCFVDGCVVGVVSGVLMMFEGEVFVVFCFLCLGFLLLVIDVCLYFDGS